jgi:processive 1,2-diacylglycerol beta-glucosyltransferase
MAEATRPPLPARMKPLGGEDGGPLVLILSASMGAGHDGVAQELARRLRARGLQVEILDILGLLPGVIGKILRDGYALMLRWAPWLYDLIFRVWFEPRGGGGPVSPLTMLAERQVRRWVADHQPALAISTFHLCSAVLGDLRRRGDLPLPSASVVVDPAVHRLWVDRDVDLHICLHQLSAAEARLRGAPRATAPGPLVRPDFTDPIWDRRRARDSLGLEGDDRVVLLVAGSWGAGDIANTLSLVRQSPHLIPVVVCGADERLRRRLVRQAAGSSRPCRIMGWVDDMARLMVAADVVLENAGGLTAMEALALGVPVVSFHPIPGHGRANVAVMARTGLVAWVEKEADLVPTLELATIPGPLRHHLISAGTALLSSDPTDDLLGLLPPTLVAGFKATPDPPRRPAHPIARPRGAPPGLVRPGAPGSRSRRLTGVRSRRQSRERQRRRLLRGVPLWSRHRRQARLKRSESLLDRVSLRNVPSWRRPGPPPPRHRDHRPVASPRLADLRHG